MDIILLYQGVIKNLYILKRIVNLGKCLFWGIIYFEKSIFSDINFDFLQEFITNNTVKI